MLYIFYNSRRREKIVSPIFGKLFKELRLKEGYTLRSYCRTFEEDPAYISRIERGKIPPPIENTKIEKLAKSVGIKKNTDEWENFFSTAKICSGRIPDEIMSDEEVVSKLPILLRTIKGQKLDDEKLDSLVKLIKKA